MNKHRYFFYTIVLSFMFSTFSFAQGRVQKVSSSGKGAIVYTEQSYSPGELLEVSARGRKVGSARFVRYSKSSRNHALVSLISGQLLPGAVVSRARKNTEFEDELEDEFADSKSDRRYSRSRSPASSASSQKGFLGFMAGYDHELRNEIIGGGFGMVFNAGYKIAPEFSLGAQLGLSWLSLSTPKVTVETTTVSGYAITADGSTSTSSKKLTATYFLLEADYYLNPNLHLGPSLGMVRASYSGASDNSPAIGMRLGYDHFLGDNFSLGGEVDSIWVFDDDDYAGLKILGAAKYWF